MTIIITGASVRLACLLVALFISARAVADDANPFDAPVVNARPRVFLRQDGGFDGLTLAKLRARVALPEFAGVRERMLAAPTGRALAWLLDGKAADRDAAIAALKKMNGSGKSWSDRGHTLVQMAALFDWLYPELDGPTRSQVVSAIEREADAAARAVERGEAPFFYSRTPGALAGLAVAGLALHGDSPKAAGYLKTFRRYGVDEYFKSCEWVGGAATGATYTLFYTYYDLPGICAAWWSATGQNPAPGIRKNQGGWLDGIVRFYLWSMRPGFAFTDINDLYRDVWSSGDQFCRGLDMASSVTRDGRGLSWARRWQARFGPALYRPIYAADLLLFRDPSIAARPLSDLPHAELFGRESCGYGFFRSDWPADDKPDTATHVFFRLGDPMDVHGGIAAGEFQVFRHAPLAARGGRYGNYDSPPDQYHRNAVSANVVLFTDPADADDRGDQNTRKGLKSDHATWDQWLKIRERNGLDVATITDWQAKPGEARCRADLTRTNAGAKCKTWQREFVWLADRHLVVLDVVEAARPDVTRRWQLHLPAAPQVKDGVLTVANRAPEQKWPDPSLRPAQREGALFCRTLLPKDYTLLVHADGNAAATDRAGQGVPDAQPNAYHQKFGKVVAQIDPGTVSPRTIFLHVLTAVDASDAATPPMASWRLLRPGVIEVKVDGAATTMAVPEWFEG
jgi:hypothetical protein